jgi:peroxiredoxin
MFNNGKKVVVLGISNDPDTTLAAWAREASFPFLMVADSGSAIGKAYGSANPRANLRNLFVIDSTGRITHRMTPFNVNAQGAYDELEKAVDQAAGVTSPP